MEGITSLNVSSFNPFCDRVSRMMEVCQHCYARRLEGYRVSLRKKLEENGALLSQPLEKIPIYQYRFPILRFNSFGELLNPVHMENLIRLCEVNPHTIHALWTKRPWLVWKAGRIPENLVLVYSNPKLDDPVPPPPGFDLAFNVITKGEGNCRRKCLECLKCYHKEEKIILERLK